MGAGHSAEGARQPDPVLDINTPDDGAQSQVCGAQVEVDGIIFDLSQPDPLVRVERGQPLASSSGTRSYKAPLKQVSQPGTSVNLLAHHTSSTSSEVGPPCNQVSAHPQAALPPDSSKIDTVDPARPQLRGKAEKCSTECKLSQLTLNPDIPPEPVRKELERQLIDVQSVGQLNDAGTDVSTEAESQASPPAHTQAPVVVADAHGSSTNDETSGEDAEDDEDYACAGAAFEEEVWCDLAAFCTPFLPDGITMMWDANVIAADIRAMATDPIFLAALRQRAVFLRKQKLASALISQVGGSSIAADAFSAQQKQQQRAAYESQRMRVRQRMQQRHVALAGDFASTTAAPLSQRLDVILETVKLQIARWQDLSRGILDGVAAGDSGEGGQLFEAFSEAPVPGYPEDLVTSLLNADVKLERLWHSLVPAHLPEEEFWLETLGEAAYRVVKEVLQLQVQQEERARRLLKRKRKQSDASEGTEK